MARGVNKVILIGNLGADPETRYTASNMAICSLRLATTERHKNSQSGAWEDRTEWHRVKLFGKQAEVAAEYLRKGRQVYIEGSIRSSKYTDKDGVERWSTEIIGNVMQMLGGQGEGGGREEGGDYHRAGKPAGHPAGAPSAGAPPAADDGGIVDDDIPF